jgi:hypothetical protein
MVTGICSNGVIVRRGRSVHLLFINVTFDCHAKPLMNQQHTIWANPMFNHLSLILPGGYKIKINE